MAPLKETGLRGAFIKLLVVGMGSLILSTTFLGRGVFAEEIRQYSISGLKGNASSETEKILSLTQLEVVGVKTISSTYFDRSMRYQGTRLRVISFSRLVDRFKPMDKADAVLLNCFDDYQGIVSLDEIRKYDLHLATDIEVRPGFKKPSWLNPLLTVVPDAISAPRMERFMTANIRQLRFVRLEEYYAPLPSVTEASQEIQAGLQAYKDNCIFCHSLEGVGGNKGLRLLEKYDFSSEQAKRRFESDFLGFHNKKNADKQDVEQFLARKHLREIIHFLDYADHRI
ncbi:MAG: hypothetical protein ACE5EK_01870 [Nitrospinales bacterium]